MHKLEIIGVFLQYWKSYRMQKLENLGTRLSKLGRIESWGKFLCYFCLQIVERKLRSGYKAKSCGCISHKLQGIAIKIHGLSRTKLYQKYQDMKTRCYNKNNKRYKDYGGRGITVCDEWLDKESGFINFSNWSLSNGYQENLQINRINNNGNYEPNNCNFITAKENSQNRRKKNKKV